MSSYPRSANYGSVLHWPAGRIMVQPGVLRLPSALAAMRAGVVLDLEAAAVCRLMGDVEGARDQLAFCRDARRFQQAGL